MCAHPTLYLLQSFDQVSLFLNLLSNKCNKYFRALFSLFNINYTCFIFLSSEINLAVDYHHLYCMCHTGTVTFQFNLHLEFLDIILI